MVNGDPAASCKVDGQSWSLRPRCGLVRLWQPHPASIGNETNKETATKKLFWMLQRLLPLSQSYPDQSDHLFHSFIVAGLSLFGFSLLGWRANHQSKPSKFDFSAGAACSTFPCQGRTFIGKAQKLHTFSCPARILVFRDLDQKSSFLSTLIILPQAAQ